MNGQRGYYGKSVFYDDSVHIPLIFCGAGIPQNRRILTPTSIMDVGPTLCALAGAPALPETDGMDLSAFFRDGIPLQHRAVFSETMELGDNNEPAIGRMVRRDNWKYYVYAGYENEDYLFDESMDPAELKNQAASQPEIVSQLREELKTLPPVQDLVDAVLWQRKNYKVLVKCSFDSEERWRCPPEACVPLENPVSTKLPERIPKWLRHLMDQNNDKKQA